MSRRPAKRPSPVMEAPPAQLSDSRWLRAAILAITALLLAAHTSSEVADTDTWWHLKTGQYIVQQHALPSPDPFSFTTYLGKPMYPGEANTRYFNLTHEWLAQVL